MKLDRTTQKLAKKVNIMSATKLSLIIAVAISKKVGSKMQEIGKVDVPVPSLADIGMQVEPKSVNEDGTPVYETDVQNGIWAAMFAATKQKMRNKLEPGTLDMRSAGDKFADTLEDLFAPAAGGGNPEAALAVTAFKKSFKDYVAKVGLAEQAQAVLCKLITSPKDLALQPVKLREKVQQRLAAYVEWAESNDPEVISNQHAINYLEKLINACEEEEELDLDAL